MKCGPGVSFVGVYLSDIENSILPAEWICFLPALIANFTAGVTNKSFQIDAD